MPLPQVNDRLKEIPAQALRTVFATIGQLLLVADRLRARAVEQLSGSGETPADRPSDPPRAPAPPSAPKPAAQDTGSARWRSLDKTGNVRLLDREDEQDEEDLAATATRVVPEPVAPEPVTQAVPEPALTEYTPTEVVPAVPALAEPTPPEPVAAEATAPAEPVPAEPALAEPAASTGATGATGAASGTLPVPDYDQASVASLRARLRVLDATQVQVVLDYEKAHEARPAVITMFERRLTKLDEGS